MGKMKQLYMRYVEMGIIQPEDGILPEEYMTNLILPDLKKDLEDEQKLLNLNKK